MTQSFFSRIVGLSLFVFLMPMMLAADSSAQWSLPGNRTLDNSSAGVSTGANGGAVLNIGYMGGNRSLVAGYTGLVLPGACVSSYFVYDLKGLLLSASLPVADTKKFFGTIRGTYLFSTDVSSEQEITWLFFPTGTRTWNQAKSTFFKLEGEAGYPVDDSYSFIGGIRWESLSTNFGDPDPSYYFTISAMESGLAIGIYQPFVGASYRQTLGGKLLSVRLAGFPVMLATLEHFNTCNNNGEPFAHVGRQDIRSGYFLEASCEIRATNFSGFDIGAFINWELYRGTCIMNLERRAMGPPQTVSAADVNFLYNRSSFTIGANAVMPFSLPF